MKKLEIQNEQEVQKMLKKYGFKLVSRKLSGFKQKGQFQIIQDIDNNNYNKQNYDENREKIAREIEKNKNYRWIDINCGSMAIINIAINNRTRGLTGLLINSKPESY